MSFGRMGAGRFGLLGAGAAGGTAVVGAAPVLSSASAGDFADIFVWGRATTDTASGTLYAVVVAGAASTPTAAQIIAGTDAAGAAAPNASLAVTSTGVKNVLVRGLTAVTSYKVCLAHQAAGGNSNVVTGSFTTDTLVIALATAGVATGMVFSAGNGSAAAATAQADPWGGANAIKWTDVNDAASGLVNCSCTVTAFFNGINKVHLTTKLQGGSAWLRINPNSITVIPNTHFNTSTGAIGTNAATWTPTPVTYDLSPFHAAAASWFMWSGQANLAGVDLNGFLAFSKGPSDNVTTQTRNGTHISDLYNIRITRV